MNKSFKSSVLSPFLAILAAVILAGCVNGDGTGNGGTTSGNTTGNTTSGNTTGNTTAGGGGGPAVLIVVEPNPINGGQSATISWTTNDVQSCTATGDWVTLGPKPTSGNESTGVLNAAGTYSYTLTCTGTDGSADGTATLKVVGSGATIACGPGQPYTPLSAPAATASTAKTNLCLLCSAKNVDNVVDADLTNFANINVPVGVFGSTYIDVTNNSPITPAGAVVFLVSDPNILLNVGLLQSLVVSTTLAGSAQDSSTNEANTPLTLRLLGLTGGSTDIFAVGFDTSKSFDDVRISAGGVANVLTDLKVYSVCSGPALPGS